MQMAGRLLCLLALGLVFGHAQQSALADETSLRKDSVQAIDNNIDKTVEADVMDNEFREESDSAGDPDAVTYKRHKLSQSISDAALQEIIAEAKQEVDDETRSGPKRSALSGLPKSLQMLHARQLFNPEGEQRGIEARTLNKIMRKLGDQLGYKTADDMQRLDGFQSDLIKQGVCAPDRVVTCNDPYSKFRTQDGTCNNLRNPLWGSANHPMRRIAKADYDDGISKPRVSKNPRYPLPNVRSVSLTIFEDKKSLSPKRTDMSMIWGQFLTHDITHGKQPNINCPMGPSNTNCDTPAECFGIQVPAGDRRFAAGSCLPVKRDVPTPQSNCRLSVREQLNELTAYIDASHIYGNSRKVTDSLRMLDGSGMLKSQDNRNPNLKNLLLVNTTQFCNNDDDPSKSCFRSGDGRTNENQGLSSVHTIMHREHNRIAQKLKKLNYKWDGERIFQETRKIIGAVMQHTSFNEFLPITLSYQMRRRFGLILRKYGFYHGYSPNVNAEIINSFAAAAFRFGHSQIRNVINRFGSNKQKFQDIEMKEFLNPIPVYDNSKGGVDSILRGLSFANSETVDGNFAKAVTDYLLIGAGKHNIGDLPAINTQRGREHGMPGYNVYRRLCGLGVAKSFNDFTNIAPKHRNQLQKLYGIPENVDLFVGGILETANPGAAMGHTFSCILAKQFQALRRGDRFWYENYDKRTGFTRAQLQEIRKISLARVICDNADNIRFIQPRILEPVSRHRYGYKTNYPQSCAYLPCMDLSQWAEQRGQRYG